MKVDLDELIKGVLKGDRTSLGKALTLVESNRSDDRELVESLLAQISSKLGEAHRIGITGVPGVGKSTFIEAMGSKLIESGHKVAVLAVDPTSTVSGGSILGDKTRMTRLANDPNAFVRPSPSSGTLGGVTRTTRESMALLECAGYDIVMVETVGIGQSETVVAEMVDIFLVLMLPGAGDELQGIKKGVLELADMIAVNKTDGENEAKAFEAAKDYISALRLTQPATSNWTPPVVNCSSLTGEGLDEVWEKITDHRKILENSGEWSERRKIQKLKWMWSIVEERLSSDLHDHPSIAEQVPQLEKTVLEGKISATAAAERLLEIFRKN
ncbi:MAG: methylmalonyl Co-A mutase-associated GTPase MeaB [Acidimicrobiales bacterium]|nr:methylmalonyl Co-A mutase-associated GTPase MeaB [Acidimicrobiales bacterium]